MAFQIIHWNGFDIQLLHPKDTWKRMINLIPYFWDDDVNFSLVVKAMTKETLAITDVWNYKWRLLDLDGNRIKEGSGTLDIIKTKWMRKYLNGYWTSGKGRAIVLGNLNPNKYYVLKVKIIDGKDNNIDNVMATFSVKDRTDFYMQIFLILFTIVMTLFFSFLAKGCGIQ